MIKKWIRKWWFWSGVALLLFCGNILYAIFAPESDLKVSLLTTFSGWISGIATIVIGIIAALQSQKYNKDREEQERSVDLVVVAGDISETIVILDISASNLSFAAVFILNFK